MIYADCLFRIADAYKLWLKQHETWTWEAWRVWSSIMDEADYQAYRAEER